MSNWSQIFHTINQSGLYQQFARQGIEQHILHRLNLTQVTPSHCAYSMQYLSNNEMYPQGLTPRHLKSYVYNDMFSRNNQYCIACESYIGEKVHLQNQNWREVHHHLCGSQICEALWALQHAIVLGLHPPIRLQQQHVSWNQFQQPGLQQAQPAQNYQQQIGPQFNMQTNAFPALPEPDEPIVIDLTRKHYKVRR
jgi:hypothetical protein